jgi:hypothetical protein
MKNRNFYGFCPKFVTRFYSAANIFLCSIKNTLDFKFLMFTVAVLKSPVESKN